jgi:hypothetical protein
MKYFWDNDSGIVPNIGLFNRGDEVPADVAQQLKDAGFTLREVKDKPVKGGE